MAFVLYQQKTPPDGEKGGEKQYKDYEKNPYLVFQCSRIKF
jgi:hypothetical protein